MLFLHCCYDCCWCYRCCCCCCYCCQLLVDRLEQPSVVMLEQGPLPLSPWFILASPRRISSRDCPLSSRDFPLSSRDCPLSSLVCPLFAPVLFFRSVAFACYGILMGFRKNVSLCDRENPTAPTNDQALSFQPTLSHKQSLANEIVLTPGCL